MNLTVYELSDPAEADIPRFVTWGESPTPWLALWQRQRGLEPNVAEWFDELRGRGARPVVARQIGVSTMSGADGLVRWRVSQIVEWCGGEWPDWLLNQVGGSRKAVIRECGGETERFSTTAEASRETGSCREDIGYWCRSGVVSRGGWAWFYDYAE